MVLDTRAKQVADKHHGIVHHGIVVIGAGFDSAFFLHPFVRRRKARVPVLEWGRHDTDDRQLERGPDSNIRDEDTYSGRPWNYTIGLTGGTNCRFGQTPPFHTR
ncbi:MAG: GMC family oxidoreductase, partial [Mesorhizobium sp.]